jgi:hypothetical protein
MSQFIHVDVFKVVFGCCRYLGWMEQGCCCLPQTLNPKIGDDVTYCFARFSSFFVSSLLCCFACHFAFEGCYQGFGKWGIQVHEVEKLIPIDKIQIGIDPLGIIILGFSFKVRK